MKRVLTSWLAGLALGGLGLLPLSSPVPARAAGPERPNILLVLADDQSYPHTSADGDPTVRTPAFDRVAREGVRFTHAFCSSPSCTPSRGALLTGQDFSRLKEGANLDSVLPREFPVYPELLEAQGYAAGYTGKGWAPGSLANGRERNPAGPFYSDFKAFLKSVPPAKPFCFWYGSRQPHRGYPRGIGLKSGLQPSSVKVPLFLPDVPEIRGDLLDYYAEIEVFDRQLAGLLDLLDASGRADKTLVVVTSDNGMPFPRAKSTLYDPGTREPLAVRWPGHVKSGRVVDDFVSLVDLAPTFLLAAGLKPPPEMTGRDLLEILLSDRQGRVDATRDKAFFGRERVSYARAGNLGYPSRALRSERFLYIRNFEPGRWPLGDPEPPKGIGGEAPVRFGDADASSPTKSALVNASPKDRLVWSFREKAFAKRPAEELYDLESDPAELTSVAGNPHYDAALKELRQELEAWMTRLGDPRVTGAGDAFDRYTYYPGDTSRRRPAPAAPAKKR